MTKILFVCSANEERSPTAERIYENYPGRKVKSAGINEDAQQPVTEELLQFADIVLCMEQRHKQYIEKKYAEIISRKIIASLDIPDFYPYMYPALVEKIKEKTESILFEYQLK